MAWRATYHGDAGRKATASEYIEYCRDAILYCTPGVTQRELGRTKAAVLSRLSRKKSPTATHCTSTLACPTCGEEKPFAMAGLTAPTESIERSQETESTLYWRVGGPSMAAHSSYAASHVGKINQDGDVPKFFVTSRCRQCKAEKEGLSISTRNWEDITTMARSNIRHDIEANRETSYNGDGAIDTYVIEFLATAAAQGLRCIFTVAPFDITAVGVIWSDDRHNNGAGHGKWNRFVVHALVNNPCTMTVQRYEEICEKRNAIKYESLRAKEARMNMVRQRAARIRASFKAPNGKRAWGSELCALDAAVLYRMRQVTGSMARRNNDQYKGMLGWQRTLSLMQVLGLWEDQVGLCEYATAVLDMASGSPLMMSPERRNNSEAYHIGNVCLIGWVFNANTVKGQRVDSEFVSLRFPFAARKSRL
jgi:hypothetical protein